jgi:hypothetical protein
VLVLASQNLGLFNESCNIFGEGLRAGFNAGLAALLNVEKRRLGVPETHVFRNEISWLSVNSSPLLPFRYRGEDCSAQFA